MHSNQALQLIKLEMAKRKLQTREAAESGTLTHSVWLADKAVYVNRDTGKPYVPHHNEEQALVFSDTPRYVLMKGGEGSGKSVAGIIKDLEKLRRGCNGVMGSPDFEHFKKSLWPEFRRWCPPDALAPAHRARLKETWVPNAPFTLVFDTPSGKTSTLLCGGFEDPGGWEGPNLNFAHFDEARRHNTASMLKVLDGRCRIPGPGEIPPQITLTTTPRKNWLFEYFGPWEDTSKPDPLVSFKKYAVTITLRTQDNEANLYAGFTEDRARSLSEAEARVLLDADWESDEEVTRFLPNMLWWDQCKDLSLGPPKLGESLVLAADAATGRKTTTSDVFGLVGISVHPTDPRLRAIRFSFTWQAEPGQKIQYRGDDFNPGPEVVIRRLCEDYDVVQFTFDPTQLIDLSQRLTEDGVVWCSEFGNVSERYAADRFLYNSIAQRSVVHDGNETLRQHVDNADRYVSDKGSNFRIVKGRGPIDLAVTASMALYRLKDLAL